MTDFIDLDKQAQTAYLIEVSKGNIAGASLVHKFGRNDNANTNYAPVAIGGIYQTPQVASATTLRIKAGGNINDTAAGTGARKVFLEGLDETGALVNEELITAGIAASAVTSITFIRLFRDYVLDSGTYASSVAGSHSGDIVIENGAGGTDWTTIDSTGFARSQTEVGAYTVPLGKTAYLLDYDLTSDGNKTFDFLFFKREGVLDSAAPYKAMRLQFEGVGITGGTSLEFPDPIRFEELIDIGFMAKVPSGTADITATFHLLLIDN